MIEIELPMDGEPTDVLWRIADCLKFVQSVPDNGDLCPAARVAHASSVVSSFFVGAAKPLLALGRGGFPHPAAYKSFFLFYKIYKKGVDNSIFPLFFNFLRIIPQERLCVNPRAIMRNFGCYYSTTKSDYA